MPNPKIVPLNSNGDIPRPFGNIPHQDKDQLEEVGLK